MVDQVVACRGRGRRRAAHRRQLPEVGLAGAGPRPPEEPLRAVAAVAPVAPTRQAVQAGLPQVVERPAFRVRLVKKTLYNELAIGVCTDLILSLCLLSDGSGAGSSGGRYGRVRLDRDLSEPASLIVSGVPTR